MVRRRRGKRDEGDHPRHLRRSSAAQAARHRPSRDRPTTRCWSACTRQAFVADPTPARQPPPSEQPLPLDAGSGSLVGDHCGRLTSGRALRSSASGRVPGRLAVVADARLTLCAGRGWPMRRSTATAPSCTRPGSGRGRRRGPAARRCRAGGRYRRGGSSIQRLAEHQRAELSLDAHASSGGGSCWACRRHPRGRMHDRTVTASATRTGARTATPSVGIDIPSRSRRWGRRWVGFACARRWAATGSS